MSRIVTIAKVVWLEMLRRKDFYVLLILLVGLLFYLMSVNTFGLSGATRYVKDVGLLLTWVFAWILTINLAARQLPQEEKTGTIFPLLAKPIARWELVIGKWLGVWTGSCVALLSFYLINVLVVSLRGSSFDLESLFQGIILHTSLIAILAALATAFSTRFHSDAAMTLSYIVTLAAFTLAPNIPEMLPRADGSSIPALKVIYYLLPHLELFDMRHRIVHGWGAAPWSIAFASFFYGVVWTLLFLLLAWLSYHKKRFQRNITG